MHFHGPIIRPQTDADSLFIEVTAGCSHNACTFCNFYKDTPFMVAPLEQIEADLQEAKREWPDAKNIWASGGNPFVLSTNKQIEVWDLMKKYYPDARISTYATISDFRQKSVEDIKRIKEHGLDEIMIGIETGDDEVLAFVNKGYTAQDILDAGKKMDEAGITYRMIYLGGLAGKGKLVESAKKSAKIFNQIHPYYMMLTNVAVLPGTKLYQQMMAGEWTEASEKERLEEIRTLIAELQIPITINSGTSTSTVRFEVTLPQEKEQILRELDKVIDRFDEKTEQALHRWRHSMQSV
ncbi:radical SAM protein [Mitsuokella sp. AF21-1AC]|uniref:radical SAM protein n=1 Tax=Mitsuokella sp. AF21-1AC TaxID=2292235 RepID=UPI000E4CC7DA|nr:radical SAM protein [Mitsuokella sp. AF21-1AC]RGS74750.1 radical SAM protein [Mitsuokella sp. AF21-1AC]